MDAIKMHASGIKNVVALMGTFISKEQLGLLKKTNSEIILLLDNDEAGYNATIKNGDFLVENNIMPSVVRLSDAKDPDEYIHKFGVDKLISNINRPISYLDFKINDLRRKCDISSTIGLTEFIKEMMNIFKYLDNITRDVISSKLSNELGIDRSLFNTLENNQVKQVIPDVNLNANKKSKYSILSHKIFYYIMNNPKYLNIYKSELNFFNEKIERDLAYEIEMFYSNHENLEFADFLGYIMQKEYLIDLINDIISGNAGEELIEEVFLEYLVLLKKKIIEDDIKKLKYQVKIELDVEKKVKLMEQLTKLKKEV